MSISLKPEHERFIQSQIEMGSYNHPDEVINEAFKLLKERTTRLEELRQKITIGSEHIANWQVVDGEAVLTRLQQKITDMAEFDR